MPVENFEQNKKGDEEKENSTILGLSTEELAGLSVEDITNNATAIKMLMHYYKQLTAENLTLKNQRNTLNTYVSAFETEKTNSSAGSMLLILSNICVGFSVGLLSSPMGDKTSGWVLLSMSILLALVGIFFNFFKSKN